MIRIFKEIFFGALFCVIEKDISISVNMLYSTFTPIYIWLDLIILHCNSQKEMATLKRPLEPYKGRQYVLYGRNSDGSRKAWGKTNLGLNVQYTVDFFNVGVELYTELICLIKQYDFPSKSLFFTTKLSAHSLYIEWSRMPSVQLTHSASFVRARPQKSILWSSETF